MFQQAYSRQSKWWWLFVIPPVAVTTKATAVSVHSVIISPDNVDDYDGDGYGVFVTDPTIENSFRSASFLYMRATMMYCDIMLYAAIH